jgi:ribose-phosphate pyrophosphokinase
MRIVAGPASRGVAVEVAGMLGAELIHPYCKEFPDGEHYFRLPDIDPNDVFIIVQGTHPPQDRNLVQLLLISSGLRDLGARKIIAVVPYLAYARQDRAFLRGEVVSFAAVLNLMKSAGIEELVTINVHAPWALQNAPIRAENLDAIPEIMSQIARLDKRIDYVFSPGKKGEVMSRTAASILNAEYRSVRSSRDPVTGEVRIELEETDLKGRNVVVIDDMISTGSTMIQIVREVRNRGAARVIAACVHGLFVSRADAQIFAAGAERIVTTDTIPTPYSVVRVSKLISEYLRTRNE